MSVLLFCFGAGATAQTETPPPANTSAAELLAEMQRSNGGMVQVVWDETLNSPRFLSGNLSAGLEKTGNDPELIARAFFSTYRNLYGMQDPAHELQVRSRVTDELGITHIRFDQRQQGVPVWGGQLVAHVALDGRLQAVNGEYYAHVIVNPQPTLSFAEAEQKALTEIGDKSA